MARKHEGVEEEERRRESGNWSERERERGGEALKILSKWRGRRRQRNALGNLQNGRVSAFHRKW